LKEKLWSQDWLQRECGILALGAMAEGELCRKGMSAIVADEASTGQVASIPSSLIWLHSYPISSTC
jgi:hypothetical protein